MKRNAKRWGHLLRSLLPDGAYALATVFLFADVYFLGARFFARDLLHLFYPTAEVLGAALRGKSSLLWDPSTFHGMPLLATWTPGVFYPPNWLNALLSAPDTFAFLIIAHLILAAAALRRLALCFTENRWAAWLAGFGYAFGGYMLSMKGNGFYLFAGALLPWAVLAFVRLMRCPSLSQMLQLIPVLVLQFFVGDVQTLYYQVLLLFPAIFLLDLNRANWRPRLGWAALGGALALGVALCQILPAWEFSALSVRATGLDYGEAATWAFHPARVAEWIVPGLFGRITPENTYWARSLVNGPHNNPWALSTHVGIVLLFGATVALGLRPRVRVLGLGMLVLVFSLLAMGSHTPLHGIAYAIIPGANVFRYPVKFMLFVTLLLSILGAVGLGAILEGGAIKASLRVQRVGLLLWALVTFCLLSLWLWMGPAKGLDIGHFAELISSEGAKVRAALAAEHLIGALGRAALMAGLLLLWMILRRRARRSLVLAFIVAVSVADLLSAGSSMTLTGGHGWLDRSPAVCGLLPRDRRPFLWRRTLPFKDSKNLISSTRVERQRRFQHETGKANIAATHCARYGSGYVGTALKNYDQIIRDLSTSPRKLLGLLSVEYLIAREGTLRSQAFESKGRLGHLGVEVYRIRKPVPYTVAFSTIHWVENFRSARKWLLSEAYRPGKNVVFEADQAPSLGGLDAGVPPRVRSIVYRAGHIKLRISGDKGYLLIKESYYPGWTARLDGRETRIYRANGLYMGIEIPAGAHSLELGFSPSLQRLATWLSALFLLGYFSLLARLYWTRRGHKSP